MTLLVVVTWLTDAEANLAIVAAAEILAGVWTFVTIRSARNPLTMRSWRFAAVDGVVALLVAAQSHARADLMARRRSLRRRDAAGRRRRRRPGRPADRRIPLLTGRSLVATTGAFVFIVYAVIFGWTIDTLRRNDARRREAEAALEEERFERARQDERLALANELHDSVLQTLQVIRTEADDPERVRFLVRSEERSVDRLINRFRNSDTGGFEAAVLAVRDEVEELYGIEVRVVIREDAPMTPPVAAAVDATREALANAARHSGAPVINLYSEVKDGRIHIYIRDRGIGFDPESVEEGRGLRHSLRSRMEAVGGSVSIESTPGEGTEDEICSGSIP